MSQPIDVHKIFASCFDGCEAVAYALSSKLAEGHICIDVDRYMEELPKLLEEQKVREYFSDDDLKFFVHPDEFSRQCENKTHVTGNDGALKPFVIHLGKAYLQRYFSYESSIIDNLKRLKKLKIITGGPGSGKTTSVATTLSDLLARDKDLRIAMAAPTGKAAARMNQAIRRFAQNNNDAISRDILSKLTSAIATTIHKLLGPVPNSVFFRHNEKNFLPWDVLVIDECSMIDGAMMAKLLNAIDERTQVYLLGDKDQLASVEAGSVFGDLCQAADTKYLKGKVEVKKGSHRFSEDKGIGKFSKAILEEKLSDLDAYAENDEVEIDINFSEAKFKEQASLFKEYIDEPDPRMALKKLDRIRFLCVTREHEHSVAETNKKIENYLNGIYRGTGKFRSSEGFYHNQVVMINRNDSILKVNNGDIALIRVDKNGTLIAYLEGEEGEPREIPAGYLNHWDTSFAMTIHKSQGSEFDNVVLILPDQKAERLLTKELLYTGVTRASKKVLIQSSREVLLKAAERSVSRTSGLQQRLLTE